MRLRGILSGEENSTKKKNRTSRRGEHLGAWGEQTEEAQLRSREGNNKGQVAPSHRLRPLPRGPWEPQKPQVHARKASDSWRDEEDRKDGNILKTQTYEPQQDEAKS